MQLAQAEGEEEEGKKKKKKKKDGRRSDRQMALSENGIPQQGCFNGAKHGDSPCRMACGYHSLEIRFNMECCENHLFLTFFIRDVLI